MILESSRKGLRIGIGWYVESVWLASPGYCKAVNHASTEAAREKARAVSEQTKRSWVGNPALRRNPFLSGGQCVDLLV